MFNFVDILRVFWLPKKAGPFLSFPGGYLSSQVILESPHIDHTAVIKTMPVTCLYISEMMRITMRGGEGK